ncbi:hypothetical protein J6590_013401 [Homalodisca vitripennis]|nr:hypothetical protein J6590_013401 [Homalodisca vitripennis]
MGLSLSRPPRPKGESAPSRYRAVSDSRLNTYNTTVGYGGTKPRLMGKTGSFFP